MAEQTQSDCQQPGPGGRLEVICGCMFSGKTEQLIARLIAAQREGQLVRAFKHAIDRRYSGQNLASHSRQRFPAQPVASAAQIPLHAGQAQVIAIDDGQFFDQDIVDVCITLRNRGYRVIVAGLDRDCWSKPFPPIPEVAAVADEVLQTHALCSLCGQPADLTHRHVPVQADQTMVGGPEAYQPRCARCFKPPVVIGAKQG